LRIVGCRYRSGLHRQPNEERRDIKVIPDVAALLVAARKPWNWAPQGPMVPPKLQSAFAANGVTEAAMVLVRIAAL
jgi:hypothetical protein